ncbi:MAG: reprolysin-like metallopeptidase [Thermoanaerobaculaceae bacterium]
MAKQSMGLVRWVVALAVVALAVAAQAEQNVWRDIEPGDISPGSAPRTIVPASCRLVTLDLGELQQLLGQAPRESSVMAEVLTVELPLPMPDGTTQRFWVVEAPVMAPELARRYPEIRTYRGQGIDDPTATLRCDLTPRGFHAQVLRGGDAVYIDPYRQGDTSTHQSYFRSDLRRSPDEPPFVCHVGEVHESHLLALHQLAPRSVLAPSGTTLRTYRLALAGTGEYTTKVCAPNPAAVACGLAAMVTSMNRVNGVYEREVAIRMVMVADNDRLVYTDGATDPYTNNNGSTMLGENQANIDAVIGEANYDIGHVFSTGGGGVAYVGVPCESGWKARGVTGRPNPVGDPFDIDYVAHEMGHQWGGYHTFNGTTGSCSGNRSSSAAYEPGSGSTIMAYAGICGSEDLQPNSDAYFHSKSFDQIIAYSTGDGDACAVKTSTGNSAPVPSAGSSYTIPMQTPFTLTGSATDPEGDALTYCWEEYDLGTQSPPQGDSGAARPIFRSFNATSSPSRTFPKLGDILTGTQSFGEWMSQRTRTMTFRLTARDNRAGGGGVNWASTTVNVSSGAGPFVVTQPASGTTWNGGGTATVTWNVANTASAPVSCSAVNILLSTDGGTTFPAVLASATPNDGSQAVSVPAITSSQARVKVACSGNIFFDISNPNFTIVCNAPQAFALVAPADAAVLSGNVVTLQWDAASGATSYDVFLGTSTDPPLLQSTAGTSLAAPATPGQTYHWKVRASNGCGQRLAPASGTRSFSVQPPVLTPAAPAEVDVTAAAGSSGNLNGVLEPGEAVLVAPRWRNEGTSAAAFGGSLSDFVGPAGASYSLLDATAGYGTLPAGASTTCSAAGGDCYLVGISDPSPRPVAHWDATVIESLSTGATRTWTLHVGRSFVDVTPVHWAYREVETLYHARLTRGCVLTPPQFCPEASTNRAEMAVFLVRAVHGPDFSPPPPTGTLFTDVPVAHWAAAEIEQLFADGLTKGCGVPGLFCPAKLVQRSEMAVFLLRLRHGSDYSPPAATGTVFADVPADHWAAAWIEQLRAEGLTTGCSATEFCPEATVTRAEMAAFLGRTLRLTLD